MADPDTLAKLKLCHAFFAELCEHADFSAMSTHADERLEKVLTRKLFQHLDFKKAGLTVPRRYFVIIAEEMKSRGMNLWFLEDIRDIYLDIDGQVFETKRGFCLGWLNEGLTILIGILLRMWRKTYGINCDFIVFNDDVLIGTQDADPERFCVLLDTSLVEYFFSYDIFVSEKKIFTSKSAVFLEEYYMSSDCKLDMRKRQIGSALFAKAFCSSYTWEAKMYSEAGYTYWENDSLLEEIMQRGYEYSHREVEMPYMSGGWITSRRDGLNTALEEEWCLANLIELKKIRLSNVAFPKREFNEKIFRFRKERKITSATQLYQLGDEIFEFIQERKELGQYFDFFLNKIEEYSGRKRLFPRILESRLRSFDSQHWYPP